ncbi:MAG TPA: hypothetical protein ENN03_10730 [bacterium]|nr:hypothetical protein [bacterium]
MVFLSALPAFALSVKNDSTAWRDSAVRIFLDLDHRQNHWQEFFKTDIPYVNYVRDTRQAQVHILITTQRTGAGGTEFTLVFLGQKSFINQNDTLFYVSKPGDTDDMNRKGVSRIIKMGLMPYVVKTPMASDIDIVYKRRITFHDGLAVHDKWDNWVFTARANIDLRGEESTSRIRFDGSVTANRITPDWKISLHGRTDYNENTYKTDEGTISSHQRSNRFSGMAVKSLGEHWSVGVFNSLSASTFANTEFSIEAAPAIEYNLFPYSQSTRREFRLLYRAGYSHIWYLEETLYGKNEEGLVFESLAATYEVREKWGNVSATLEGFHYFHDFSKNHLRLSGWFSFRIWEGLSLSLSGSYSVIRDRLGIPKGDLTVEDILLSRKQLATGYDYRLRLGISYTFGSIYSNVVNPRFGT